MRSAADAAALGMAFQIEAKPDGARRFTFVGQRCLAVNGVPAEAAMADAAVLYNMILPEHRAAFDAAEAQALATLRSPSTSRSPCGAPTARCAGTASPRCRARSPTGACCGTGCRSTSPIAADWPPSCSNSAAAWRWPSRPPGLGFWEWDIAAGKVTWSERNKALFGLAPDEPVTVQRYLELVHPEDVEAVREAFLAARDKPDGGDYLHRAPHRHARRRAALDAGPRAGSPTDAARRSRGWWSAPRWTSPSARPPRSAAALLMGELAHRAKNGIAIMMAIVGQTARGQESVEGFRGGADGPPAGHGRLPGPGDRLRRPAGGAGRRDRQGAGALRLRRGSTLDAGHLAR